MTGLLCQTIIIFITIIIITISFVIILFIIIIMSGQVELRVTRDRGQGMTEFSLKAIQLQAVMINTFNLMPGSVDIERNLDF